MVAVQIVPATAANMSTLAVTCMQGKHIYGALRARHLVVPVYGLMRGLPGSFSTPSNLQRISMVRSSTGCMLIKSARDSAGSNRFATAAVYDRQPFTCRWHATGRQSPRHTIADHAPRACGQLRLQIQHTKRTFVVGSRNVQSSVKIAFVSLPVV